MQDSQINANKRGKRSARSAESKTAAKRSESSKAAKARPAKGKHAGSSHGTAFELSRPVFLIGFMGAGKSSVARKLARTCGVASVDLDTYLERKCGRSISSIFEEGGEALFRRIETEILEELAYGEYPMLISCGGGIITTPRNREVLKDAGYVVYLEVNAAEASSRISDKSTRPLFNDLEGAQRRLQERRPLYEECAHGIISTKEKKVHEVAYEVKRMLEEEGVLCRLAR